MYLCRAECDMQERRDDFEGELPLIPEGAEEVEDDEGFGEGAEEGGAGAEEEEAGEEEVAGRVDAVEDHGDVGEEFADDVEGTPYGTENELDSGISLLRQIQTDSNGCLRYHDGSHVMHRADDTDPDTVNQLKNIHPHQHLRTHHQYIPHRDLGTPRERIIQHGIAKRHVDKRIHGHDQDE